jgi:nickel transport protein
MIEGRNLRAKAPVERKEKPMHCNPLKTLVISCLLVSLAFAAPLYAHKVNIFAYIESGKIHAESYFPDGKPVEGGAVELLDSRGNKLAESATDREGKCVLPIPEKKGDLTIVINASMGHRNTFILKKSELGE